MRTYAAFCINFNASVLFCSSEGSTSTVLSVFKKDIFRQCPLQLMLVYCTYVLDKHVTYEPTTSMHFPHRRYVFMFGVLFGFIYTGGFCFVFCSFVF